MTGVDRVHDGDSSRVRVSFDRQEAEILSEVADQFITLVTDTPDDPAASKLFPDGYADPASQAEFSRYTRADLSERKVAAARTVRDALRGPSADAVVVELTPESAWDWLTFFTDIRLVLAERLRVSAGEDEHELQQGLYDWTAYVQGAIVDELSQIAEPGSSL